MSIYDFKVKTIEGDDTTLQPYQGKALLIVNVASKCGFTPQYEGLEKLHEKFKDQGFSVLGFPCNQFGFQEPGAEGEIKAFCESTYHVTFPLFAKVYVNGAKTHPLYAFLKKAAKGVLGTENVKWNFTKFLVDSKGAVIKRYAPTVKPEAIEIDVKGLVKK